LLDLIVLDLTETGASTMADLKSDAYNLADFLTKNKEGVKSDDKTSTQFRAIVSRVHSLSKSTSKIELSNALHFLLNVLLPSIVKMLSFLDIQNIGVLKAVFTLITSLSARLGPDLVMAVMSPLFEKSISEMEEKIPKTSQKAQDPEKSPLRDDEVHFALLSNHFSFFQ